MTTWRPDQLLKGYECAELSLAAARRAPGEPDDVDLSGNLIRLVGGSNSRSVVLYLHGWADYFFQTHLAEAMRDAGHDFVALELRRYGRGLREGHLAGYIDDLTDYYDELDAALEVVRQDHDRVTLMAHSTGGLVAALWVADRPGAVDALVLNSPWLALQASAGLETVARSLIGLARRPTQAIPLPDSGFYARSINAELGGEWTFDLGLKQHPSFQVRAGWAQAIMAGHARVAKGLDLDLPVLMMISDHSNFRRVWDDDMLAADTVLDVRRLARAAVSLGRHVTLVRIEGGLHDLVLSAPEVRATVFDQMSRFLRAYLPDSPSRRLSEPSESKT